jgi:protein-tyrosine kinase
MGTSHRIITAMERARDGGAFGTTWLGRRLTDHTEISADAIVSDERPTKPNGEFTAHLSEQRLIALGQQNSAIDAYRILRTQVLARMRAGGLSTLAVTSPALGDGKSLTAANLAMSIAMDPEHQVLLVDCDLRTPKLHELFGTNLGPGLGDYLSYNLSLKHLIVKPPLERIALLPAGRAVLNSAEMLASQKMRRLVQGLKAENRSRFVIFDLPAVLRYADALSVLPLVDAVLMVAEERKTRLEDIARAGELLAHSNLIGTVLNKTESSGGFAFKRG